MKRNWDTVRSMLLAVEELEPTQTLSLSDYDSDKKYEASYHAKLLYDAGSVNGIFSQTLGNGPIHFTLRELTWEGHEFLDSIRNKNLWEKVKSTLSEKGGAMTFELIKTAAASLVKSSLG